MRSEGVWASRDRGFRVGAIAALAAMLAIPAFQPAAAQDDRYPAVAAPAPAAAAPALNSSETQGRRRRTIWRTPVVTPAPQQPAPPQTQPPITTANLPPPSTTVTALPPHNAALDGVPLDPKWPKQFFVVSDSVMLGAKPALARGIPDWQMIYLGRPALMIPKALEELPPSVGSVAVVALGYNTLWEKERKNFNRWADAFDKSAEAMLTALKARGAKKIVWVMLRELYPDNVPSGGTVAAQVVKYGWYFPYVNERLRALKERHPEIALADWVTAGRQGGITYDSIHLNVRGAELMVDVVRAAMGLPPRPPKDAFAQAKPAEESRPRVEIETMKEPAAPAAEPAAPAAQNPAEKPAEPSLGLRKSDPESTASVTPMTKPSYAFRDCAKCPEMVVVPAGSFTMGSPDTETDRNNDEGPQRLVTIARPFAVGKFEVTFGEWDACVAGGGCKGNPSPGDEGWGKDPRQPAINVSWDDAQEYVTWLAKTTGKSYRLLTEAEWEYAARAGTGTPYTTGDAVTPAQANFQTAFKENGEEREGEYREKTIKVGSFPPNAFDLYDVHGNVWEWVQDNYHEDFAGAPTDGSVMPGGDATMRVKRGGGWYSLAPEVRSASRQGDQPDHRGGDIGFRVARGL